MCPLWGYGFEVNVFLARKNNLHLVYGERRFQIPLKTNKQKKESRIK